METRERRSKMMSKLPYIMYGIPSGIMQSMRKVIHSAKCGEVFLANSSYDITSMSPGAEVLATWTSSLSSEARYSTLAPANEYLNDGVRSISKYFEVVGPDTKTIPKQHKHGCDHQAERSTAYHRVYTRPLDN